jgi:hypothetical protein
MTRIRFSDVMLTLCGLVALTVAVLHGTIREMESRERVYLARCNPDTGAWYGTGYCGGRDE